jgi:hypothetical protein
MCCAVLCCALLLHWLGRAYVLVSRQPSIHLIHEFSTPIVYALLASLTDYVMARWEESPTMGFIRRQGKGQIRKRSEGKRVWLPRLIFMDVCSSCSLSRCRELVRSVLFPGHISYTHWPQCPGTTWDRRPTALLPSSSDPHVPPISCFWPISSLSVVASSSTLSASIV